jgi:hypothetical protein
MAALLISGLVLICALGVYDGSALTSLPFISVLKIFKASKIVKANSEALSEDENNDLAAEIGVLVVKLCGIVFVTTGLVLEVSTIQPSTFRTGHNSVVPMEWHTAFYFVIITLSTVGYGDVVPTGTQQTSSSLTPPILNDVDNFCIYLSLLLLSKSCLHENRRGRVCHFLPLLHS